MLGIPGMAIPIAMGDAAAGAAASHAQASGNLLLIPGEGDKYLPNGFFHSSRRLATCYNKSAKG